MDGALTVQARTLAVPPLRNASAPAMQCAAGQSGGHQCHQLVAGVGPARGVTKLEEPINQFAQTQAEGESGWQHQPGIGHQTVIVKGDLDEIRVLKWQHPKGAPSLGWVLLAKTIIPDTRKHPFTLSGHP